MLLRFFFVSKRSNGALKRHDGQHFLIFNQETNEILPLRNEEDRLELKLTLDREVLDCKVVLPVVSQALVERGVLLRSDVLRVTGPDRLRLVELLVRCLLLFDLLHFLLLWLILVFHFFDLGLLFFVFFRLLFLILNLLEKIVRIALEIET